MPNVLYLWKSNSCKCRIKGYNMWQMREVWGFYWYLEVFKVVYVWVLILCWHWNAFETETLKLITFMFNVLYSIMQVLFISLNFYFCPFNVDVQVWDIGAEHGNTWNKKNCIWIINLMSIMTCLKIVASDYVFDCN